MMICYTPAIDQHPNYTQTRDDQARQRRQAGGDFQIHTVYYLGAFVFNITR